MSRAMQVSPVAPTPRGLTSVAKSKPVKSSADILLLRMSVQVGILAITVACLIGIGQMSLKIPLIISTSVLLSWLFTDALGWIRLHRFVVYIAMIAGAIYAIWDYLNSLDPEQSTVDMHQLYSVANMLVYAQVPLFFQQKSRRIYEQLGVFLILELVVAALVNDNVFFGMLLVPTLAMSVSAMILFASYQSVATAGPVVRKTTHPWILWIAARFGYHWDKPIHEVIHLSLNEPVSHQAARPGWLRVALPLTLALAVMSGAYFYALPRLNSGSYAAGGFGRAMVGFTDTVSLQQVGRMLQNERLVLRVDFRDATTGEPFRPTEPPYLRAVALNEYRAGSDAGTWVRGEYNRMISSRSERELQSTAVALDRFVEQGEFVTATITEQSRMGKNAISIPPFFRGLNSASLSFQRDCWELIDQRSEEEGFQTPRRKYDFVTQSYVEGRQTPLIPESEDVFDETNLDSNYRAARTPYQALTESQFRMLTHFSASRFIGLRKLRDRILKNSRSSAGVIDRALAIEAYLATGVDYQYTLDLTQERDDFLDPIEDFVVNQKKGHCQFFASTLAMMLRSMGVPSRVVVGFRPSDYNGVGDYFLVKQLHAHSWVEAYFTRQEFEQTTRIALPESYGHGAWLRFDPTPPGEGSNAGGTLRQPDQQTLDFAQQLWKDYVMDIDSSNRSELLSVFSSASGGAYQRFFLGIQAAILRMQQGQFIAGFLSLEQNFAWKVGLMVSALLVMVVAIWRLAIWMLARRMRRQGYGRSRSRFRTDPQFEFFRKCMLAIESMGIRRSPDQTPREVTRLAKERLLSISGLPEKEIPLEFLTDQYYRLRYGDQADPINQRIDEQLRSNSNSVVRMIKQFRKALLRNRPKV